MVSFYSQTETNIRRVAAGFSFLSGKAIQSEDFGGSLDVVMGPWQNVGLTPEYVIKQIRIDGGVSFVGGVGFSLKRRPQYPFSHASTLVN